METLVVEVRGMRCEGCERTVRDAVEALPGVRRAAADLVAEEVEVVFDRAVPEADVRAAVAAAGFVPGPSRSA